MIRLTTDLRHGALILSLFSLVVPNLSNAESRNNYVLLGAEKTDPDYYDNIPQLGSQITVVKKFVDLSEDFPPPGDQANEASCVAWAVAYGAGTYAEARNTHLTAPLRTDVAANQLSPAFLFNLARWKIDPAECDPSQGLRLRDALAIAVVVGSVALDQAPYVAGHCARPSDALIAKAREHRLSGFEILGKSGKVDLSRVIESLSAGRPIIVSLKIDRSFISFSGGGFVTGSGQVVGRHAVVVLGFNDRTNAVKILNSWGSKWGDSGYAWIPYNNFLNMAEEAYAISGDLLRPDDSHGPEITAKEQEYSAFIDAARTGNIAALKKGLKRGLRGDVVIGRRTALDQAVSTLRPDEVKLLLDADADPNAGHDGYNAISSVADALIKLQHRRLDGLRVGASEKDVVTIFRLLVSHGLRINLLDGNGSSAFCSIEPTDGVLYSEMLALGAKCINPPVAFSEKS